MNGDNDQLALSDRHKEAVKAWIPKVRKVLEKDMADQLSWLGIRPGGKITPLGEMSLPDDAVSARLRAEALLERETIDRGEVELIAEGKELPPLSEGTSETGSAPLSLPRDEKSPKTEGGGVLGAPPAEPAGA